MFPRYRVDSGRTQCWIQCQDVFSRYCIYYVEDFKCILPVSIDSGKTHKKSPAHSSFRGFLQNVFGRFSRLAITSLHPHPAHYTNMFCSSGPVHKKKSYICHPGIEFLTPVATWSGQYTWIVVQPLKYVFCCLKDRGPLKQFFKSAEMLSN